MTFPDSEGLPVTHERGAIVSLDPDNPEVADLVRNGWLREVDETVGHQEVTPVVPAPSYDESQAGLVPDEVTDRQSTPHPAVQVDGDEDSPDLDLTVDTHPSTSEYTDATADPGQSAEPQES